jgi:hypothetical protein
MPVIARDQVASDHLVYAWPFPIGPECEISCNDDEKVVMCPAWTVGDCLGPGRHHWRTPDPSRPTSAFFVLTAPVEVSFDMTTMFLIPTTGQPVRLRAAGSLQVQCPDPSLLIAQFVGLPFDTVNDGILRSVTRSVERMLARLLTRRVVMAATPMAVTDPQMMPSIIEELIAYNPTAGAVFGVDLIRMGHLTIAADDGSTPQVLLPGANVDWSGRVPRLPANGETHPPPVNLSETQRGRPTDNVASPLRGDNKLAAASGEISVPTEVKRSADEITAPALRTPAPGSVPVVTPAAGSPPPSSGDGGSILGIGVGHIGAPIGGSPAPPPPGGGGGSPSTATAAGEIKAKVAPGSRVLVPGPNGLMQSATVRQLLQGYYELEVGSSGETIWVPISGVVPE